MAIGGTTSLPLGPQVGAATHDRGRAPARADAPAHAQESSLADLAEEISVMVSQTRSRRFDRASEDSAGTALSPNSLEDELADMLSAQEDAAMGRRARTPQEEEAEKAELRDDKLRRGSNPGSEEAYYDLLPDTASPKAKAALDMLAAEFSDHLHELGRDGSSSDVLAFLMRRLPEVLPSLSSADGEIDPPLLYAALLYLEERLRKTLREKDVALDLTRVAIEKLLLRHQPELRIGLIIADATYQFFAESLGSAVQARSMYRREVLEHTGILKTFSKIADKFGVQRFGPAISFLLDASADDLASTSAAADRERLKVVRDDLYELVTLNTVMRQGDGMVERVRQRHVGCLASSASITSIMKFTLRLAENPLSELASSVTTFAKTCVPGSIFVRCAFLQLLRSIALMMPDKIFEQEAERRGYDTKGMNPKEHVVEMFDEAMEEAFEQEQMLADFDDEEEFMGAAG